MTDRILLFGAKGNLGSAFGRYLTSSDVEELGRAEIGDISYASLERFFKFKEVSLVINCAGEVDAEKCERNPDIAYLGNAVFPGLLASLCDRYEARFLHFSSTGVYGNSQNLPYSEYDHAMPTTVHHKSKLAGEHKVLRANSKALILRTGWLFGGNPNHNKSFVWDRLCEAKGIDVIKSDPRQSGNPTWVDDVVKQSLLALENRCEGIFNCVSFPPARRIDYVSYILEAAGLDTRVIEGSEEDFRRIAPVSPNETAKNYKLNLLGLDIMPSWTQSMRNYVNQLLDETRENK